MWTQKSILARGQRCLQKLYTRPEKVIAVVSHSGFLRAAISRRQFANADYRIFDFEEPEDGRLALKEWEETDVKGGGMGRSPVGEQQLRDDDFPVPLDAQVDGEAAPEIP